MNHDFQPNPSEPLKCIDCGYPIEQHGPNAVCESCANIGQLNPFGLGNKMALLCRDCIEREKQVLLEQGQKDMAEFQSPERQEARLAEYNRVVKPYEHLIANARKIDESIHLSTDIFNAKTVAFTDLRDAINADESISADDKHFELARLCKERIAHFQKVIFDLDKAKIEAYSEQKSWHLQLNDLANRLRTDERERLRISDITYDVKMPKVVTPRTIKMSQNKATKAEIRALSVELKIPEFTLQLVATSKNWTAEQLGNHFRRTIKEGQSISRKDDESTNETNGEIK